MRFIVLDTESTGLKPPVGVCEIAWTEIAEDFSEIRSVSSLIDPEMAIEPGASGVHGIMNKHVQDAPTLAEFFSVVERDPFGDDEVVVIGHNVAFDDRLVGSHIRNKSGLLCTLRCSRRIYKEAPDHKLSTLKFWLELGEGVEDSHRAAGDVRTTLALLKRLSQDSGLDLKGLYDLSNSPMPITKIGFGKHKGKLLSELPADYVHWLLNKADNLDPDLRAALLKL